MKLVVAVVLEIWVFSEQNAVLLPSICHCVVAVAASTEELPFDGSNGQTQSEAAETGPHL